MLYFLHSTHPHSAKNFRQRVASPPRPLEAHLRKQKVEPDSPVEVSAPRDQHVEDKDAVYSYEEDTADTADGNMDAAQTVEDTADDNLAAEGDNCKPDEGGVEEGVPFEDCLEDIVGMELGPVASWGAETVGERPDGVA